MTEEKEDLVTFKIRAEQRDWAEDEQRRLRRQRGKKVTQADLFELMRTAYNPTASARGVAAGESTLTDDERDVVAMMRTSSGEFLFETLQTAVKSAIKEYRKKWKEAAAPKAPGKGAVHERRPTGT